MAFQQVPSIRVQDTSQIINDCMVSYISMLSFPYDHCAPPLCPLCPGTGAHWPTFPKIFKSHVLNNVCTYDLFGYP